MYAYMAGFAHNSVRSQNRVHSRNKDSPCGHPKHFCDEHAIPPIAKALKVTAIRSSTEHLDISDERAVITIREVFLTTSIHLSLLNPACRARLNGQSAVVVVVCCIWEIQRGTRSQCRAVTRIPIIRCCHCECATVCFGLFRPVNVCQCDATCEIHVSRRCQRNLRHHAGLAVYRASEYMMPLLCGVVRYRVNVRYRPVPPYGNKLGIFRERDRPRLEVYVALQRHGAIAINHDIGTIRRNFAVLPVHRIRELRVSRCANPFAPYCDKGAIHILEHKPLPLAVMIVVPTCRAFVNHCDARWGHVIKYADIYVFRCVAGEYDLRQTVTIAKRLISDVPHAATYRYVRKTTTIVKRRIPDARNGIWYRHACQVTTRIKRACADFRYGIGDRNVRQSAATGKCRLSNVRHGIGDRYARQSAATGKSPLANVRYGIWHRYAR